MWLWIVLFVVVLGSDELYDYIDMLLFDVDGVL